MEGGLALAFANGVIGKLGEVAAEKALNEASLLVNFKTDFKWLEKELSQLFTSLQAADQLTGHNEPVKKWLAEVRNICFDAEDIVDECSVEHLYTNTSQSCVCSCSQLVFQYKMGKRIKELKDRISSTIEEAQRLKLFHDVAHLSRPSTSTSTIGGEELRRWDIFETNSPAVAIDHKVDEILTLLDNPAIGVVAVVGMGGLGKTFLLHHVYDRTKHRAWASLCQQLAM
ncbi:hypothetical protein SUGI_0358060 [Cryptomeria japonica]|nr:hypothetical protein SUGI_0358060 [Cryptomeria japonica]